MENTPSQEPNATSNEAVEKPGLTEPTKKESARPGRLIIRNLQYDMNEDHLRKLFSTHG